MKKLLKRFALGIAVFALVSSLTLTGCKQLNGGGDDDFDLPPLELDIDLDKASSVEFARSMLIGWNLGNTFDAPTETNWGMPKTTKAMITAVRKAGFRSIRIPVSWSKHIINSDYKIDDAWINRVKEVVDYAYEQGMYVIINIHHDNYSETELATASGFALSNNSEIQQKSKDYIEKVWTQIATKFASYDKRLIFEVLNEPRAVGTGDEWYIHADADVKKYCDIITSYEQVAINTIRGIKGNEDRFIMVPGYAASGSDSRQLDAYTMPKDIKEQDKLILSAHAYSPLNFAMSDSTDRVFGDDDDSALEGIFKYLREKYISKGIGIIMGEASASDKNNTDERIKWAKSYFTKASKSGIPVMLWDNMVTVGTGGNIESGECHGYFNRKGLSWYFPELVNVMVESAGGKAYSGDDGKTPPTNSELLSAELDLTAEDWSVNESVSAVEFSEATDSTVLVFTIEKSSVENPVYKNLKLQWSWGATDVLCKGTVTGGTISGDVFAPNVPGTMEYKPTSDEWIYIKKDGLIINGYGLKVTSLKLK